jgi:23S rRNA pseudouridine2605 synthase
MAEERLQKILARAGVSSRRAAERLITDGQVRVNGAVVSELGARADAERDRIEVVGRLVGREEHVYFIVHKPRGMVTTLNDPEGRPSLSELLDQIEQRVYPIGRLDFHTSGALLLTNDGDLAQALLHPSREVPKTYVAKISHKLDDKGLYMLRSGVTLDDGYHTRQASVIELRVEEGKSWLELTITEGKNRQIHRMIEAIGARVMRLSRLSFAGVSSEGLRPGQIRELDANEVAQLKRSYLGTKAAREPAPKQEENARQDARGARAKHAGEARGSAREQKADTRNAAPTQGKGPGGPRAQRTQAPARKKPDAFDRTRSPRHKRGPT